MIRNNEYIYNVGDVLHTVNSDLKIINKTRLTNNNRKGYICECALCKNQFQQVEYNLKNKIGCPYCTNKSFKIGFNDMWTTSPKIAKLLENPEDGFNYTKASGKKVNWKCDQCGEIINRSIDQVYKRGLICSKCSSTKSYPNRFMYNLLKYLNVDFEDEKIFNWSKFDNTFKRYDFYIPSYGIVEMMGNQHYAYSNFHKLSGRTLQDEIDNDNFKKELALNNGINNYVKIDCRKSNMNYIKNNILNSELSKYLNLYEVDWSYIDLESQKNIFEYICDLWSSGHKKEDIIKITGLSKSVINKYFRRAIEYNLIEYDFFEIKDKGKIKSRTGYYNKHSMPIMCKEINLYFGSVTICAKTMKEKYNTLSDRGSILAIINGIRKSREGFTFQYITKQEFNRIKTESPELVFGDFFYFA